MEAILKAWKTSRQLYLKFFDHYSLEQLNKIPQGFSNNLIWNIGHVIVAQQSLVYRGSNVPMPIPESLLEMYKPGTRPTRDVTQEEVKELKHLLIAVIDQFESDIQKDIFKTYQERTTAT
jgi:hypothetical protein